MNRRFFFALLGATAAPAAQVRGIFAHDLPEMTLDHHEVTVLEVTFEPGVISSRHQHPGFIVGYVLEGPLRFQIEGQPEVVHQTGELFWEPKGAVHAVAASASPTKAAKILAFMIAPKGAPAATPVKQD